MPHDRCPIAKERGLAEKRLIELGLNALARAAQRSYFADGHRGASMISAHLMCADNDLGEATTNRVVECRKAPVTFVFLHEELKGAKELKGPGLFNG